MYVSIASHILSALPRVHAHNTTLQSKIRETKKETSQAIVWCNKHSIRLANQLSFDSNNDSDSGSEADMASYLAGCLSGMVGAVTLGRDLDCNRNNRKQESKISMTMEKEIESRCGTKAK